MGVYLDITMFAFLIFFVGTDALQTTRVIKLTQAVSKATYLPVDGERYLQNGKIIENPSSTRFGSRCPYDYPEEQAALCYKPCPKRNDWAFVRPVGPVCWGCPTSHPSEEASLCYRKCPKDKPHKSTVNCFGDCPSGYRNDGLTCFRDAHITSADNSGCPWYDKCGLTLKKGCSKCPSDYKNDGCTCRRDPHAISRPVYNRGVGVVLRSQPRGAGKAILLLPKYEAPYDTPACSIGNWQAQSYVHSDTEMIIFTNNNQRVIVFGFRGTEATSLADWFKNIDFQPSATTIGGTTFNLHKGFKDRYNNIASDFENEYRRAIQNHPGYKLIITGHSLGGAEAFIAAAYAAGSLNRRPDAVITYGAPLTGNQAFANYYRSAVGCDRTLIFAAKGDIIPGIPKAFGYTHVCDTIEVNGGGDFLQAHDLHVGYQKGLAAKYGNSDAIKAGCDIPL